MEMFKKDCNLKKIKILIILFLSYGTLLTISFCFLSFFFGKEEAE